MGRTRGAGSKQDFLKGRPGVTARSTVSLRHVDVPNAELRLEQALEVLLSGDLTLDKMTPDRRPGAEGNQGQEDPATDGDGK